MTDHPQGATEHKELTKKEAEALISAAFKQEQRIKKGVVNFHESWWELAAELYAFHESGGWALVGYDTLDEFLAQPEIGMSRSQFFQMTKTHRDLVVVKKLPPESLKELEPSKVREVIPAIMRGDVSAEDALDDAAGLSYSDVKRKYRPEKQGHGQKADDSQRLAAETEPEAIKCSTCGQWWEPPEFYDEGMMLTAEELEVLRFWAQHAATQEPGEMTAEEANLIAKLSVIEGDADELPPRSYAVGDDGTLTPKE
jgi:hypothetical protein